MNNAKCCLVVCSKLSLLNWRIFVLGTCFNISYSCHYVLCHRQHLICWRIFIIWKEIKLADKLWGLMTMGKSISTKANFSHIMKMFELPSLHTLWKGQANLRLELFREKSVSHWQFAKLFILESLNWKFPSCTSLCWSFKSDVALGKHHDFCHDILKSGISFLEEKLPLHSIKPSQGNSMK